MENCGKEISSQEIHDFPEPGVCSEDMQINTKTGKIKQDVNYRHFSAFPIVALFMYAFITTASTMILFGPYSIGMTLFPNKSSTKAYGHSSSLCTVNQSSQEFIDSVIVNEYASVLNIYFILASGLPSIVSNVLFGAFSDYFGRKFLFILPIIGSLIKNITCILGIYYKTNYIVLIAGFLVEGLTGVYFSLLLGGFAVVADITKSDQSRSLGIAILTIGIGISTVVASAATGYFISSTNSFIWPLVLSCGLLLLCLFMVLCILPETYSVDGSKDKNCKVVITYIKEVFGFYYKKSMNRGMYNLCIWAFIFTNITVQGRTAVETLFQIKAPFCWNTIEIGWFNAFRIFGQVILVLSMIKLFQMCMEDDTIAAVGSVSGVAGFILEGLATSNLFLYLVPAVGAGGFIALPMMRSIVSRITPVDKQGAMLGSVAAIETICYMGGNILTNAIYAKTEGIMGGFVFFVMGGFSFLALVLLLVLIGIRNISEKKSYQALTDS